MSHYEYQILAHSHRDALQTAVNTAIAEGWYPLGGLSVILDPRERSGVELFQAMSRITKKSKKENEPI